MITAVDSNVLLDVFGAVPIFGPTSANSLRAAIQVGRIVACDVVWAEVAGSFKSKKAAQRAFELASVEFSPLSLEAAHEAGISWRSYRAQGGTRTRVIADFLIGAHALHQADRLLSRDRGFYRSYFKRLSILDPRAT